MTGRKKDIVKRDRIAQLLRQGLSGAVIAERLSCSKDIIASVRVEIARGER